MSYEGATQRLFAQPHELLKSSKFPFLPTARVVAETMAPPVRLATCAAPTNIATIKYWGKDDAKLNSPLNSSVSITLHQDQLRTKTTAAASPAFSTTQLWLNGKEQPLNGRVATVLREMKALAHKQHGDHGPHAWHLRIVSENSFPTAAGLASSAAGYACLVATLAELYQVKDEFPGHLSTIARQGSGSACRSMFGGFVRWEKGEKSDGSDSRAIQVADEHHWPSLCAIICVVNDKEKDTSSTDGMGNSKNTSELLKYRASTVVSERLSKIEAAYKARDFATFGKLTMQDSNQFHAVCLDTYPPIFYMNSVSRRIIQLVHRYNDFHKEVRAAYTFDAGPNAVIFAEQQHVPELVALLARYFPSHSGSHTLPVKSCFAETAAHASRAVPQSFIDAARLNSLPDSIKMLYVTRVGGGPRVLPDHEALVDPVHGTPRLPNPARHQSQDNKASRAPLLLAASLAAATVLLGIVQRR